MALKNSAATQTPSKLPIPLDSIVISAVQFPAATMNINPATGLWDGTVKRYIQYDLCTYSSLADLQALDPYIAGGTLEYGVSWIKEMSEAEYLSILANGLLAEVWLKEHLDAVVPGNNAEIIDPYVPI